ncbi:MAG: DUF2169 domain-containing protein [Gemmatimonadales bacterium]
MTHPAPDEREELELPPAAEPATEMIVTGRIDGKPTIGLVLKRTYKIGPRGGWEPAPDDDQEVVVDEELPYEEVEPPFDSPVFHGSDVMFRPLTDIVVQGSAHARSSGVGKLTVGLRIESLKRDITVYGERRVERASGGLRLSEPEPFETIPIRYDRAYGGVDLHAFYSNPSPMLARVQRNSPGLPVLASSRYHYPRNPTGVGFLISMAPYQLEDLLVPSLEFPFDPITADRLAVGTVASWPNGPLPAGMDWSSAAWFPRESYLGHHSLPEGYGGRIIERELGWAPADLLEIPLFTRSETPIRAAYAQGASPGMSIPLELERIRQGIPAKLVNLHPGQPELRMELPREWPEARLDLGGLSMTALAPSLSAVVIRPDDEEVVMVWHATADESRERMPEEYAAMRFDVAWRRDPR